MPPLTCGLTATLQHRTGFPLTVIRAVALPALIAAVLLGAAAPGAIAAPGMLFGIADDGVTQRNAQLAPKVVPEWKATGMDVARVLVIWSYVAPGSDRTTRPADFDPSNPNDPQYNWGPVDQAVELLTAQGIEPILNVTGYIPFWGSLDPGQRRNRYKPDAEQFATFVKAVAQRYDGRVRRYILWNEPNLVDWLQPQNECVQGRCTPVAPHMYREIARKAVPAIKAGSPGAQVYGPALASKGDSPTKVNVRTRPLAFLRALGCVDAQLRRDRKSKHCRGFKPATLDGIAYHPHSTTFAPDRGYTNVDDANLADYPRLIKTIDAVQKAGGLVNGVSESRKFDLHYDEYGYQTNPPDPLLGVSTAQQSSWMQWGAYAAYKQPRVRMLIQYLWRDDPINPNVAATRYAGWQSGLYYFDGNPKPARKTFPHPFWASLPKGSRTAELWGQVRPGGIANVTVQKGSGGSWATLRKLATDARGYFRFTNTVTRKSSFRFRYTDSAGRLQTSSVVTVAPARKPSKPAKPARRR